MKGNTVAMFTLFHISRWINKKTENCSIYQLTGKALTWADAVCFQGGTQLASYNFFVELF